MDKPIPAQNDKQGATCNQEIKDTKNNNQPEVANTETLPLPDTPLKPASDKALQEGSEVADKNSGKRKTFSMKKSATHGGK